MSILEKDLKTGDISIWENRIRHARQSETPLPYLENISPSGNLYNKIVRYIGVDLDSVMVQVFLCRVDEEGEIISGTEHQIKDPDFLLGPQISEANIQVGSKILIWQETNLQL